MVKPESLEDWELKDWFTKCLISYNPSESSESQHGSMLYVEFGV